MHKWAAVVVVLALSLPAITYAQGGGGRGGARGAGAGGARGAGPGAGGPGRGGPPQPVAGHGVEVPGWWARLDDPRQISQPLKFAPAGAGIHATTGPAAIYWHPQEYGEGQYSVKATFALIKVPSSQEPYGLLIGGNDLGANSQRYTEFLLRPDGRYLVRTRNGAATTNVSGEWADHMAIVKADASGRSSNELSVRVTPAGVTFLANGMEISKQPASAVDAQGIAGVRVGRDLDVQIDGFDIEQAQAPTNTR